MKLFAKRFFKIMLAACMLTCMLPMGIGASAADQHFTEKDVAEVRSTILTNKYHATYVDIMMRQHILSETDNYRIERNLKDGKSVVFFFEGCSDNVDDKRYGDYNTYRLASYCAVVQLKDGVPTVVHESEFCSTLPDNPRKPETNEDTPVPTVLDGVYNIVSTNHGGSYAALWIESNGVDVPVMRCTQTSYYVSTSAYINIHARSQFSGAPTDGITPTSYSSAGCFNVGKVSDSFRDYNKFIELILGVKNARKPDWNNNKCVSGKDYGVVVVDRSHYVEQLTAIYGGKSNKGDEIAKKIAEYSTNLHNKLFGKLGDVNGDDTVDKFDYILVKRDILGTYNLDDIETIPADVNKSGEVDKFDYIFIKRNILGTYKIEG